MKRYILTLIFFFALLITGEMTLNYYKSEQIKKNNKELDFIGNNISKSIQKEINVSISAVTMNELMLKTNEYDTQKFESWAKLILSNFKSINNIQLAPNGVVQYIYPLKGNEKAIGHNLLQDPKRKIAALKALESGEITFIGPIKLIQNGRLAIIVRKPISNQSNKNDNFWGFSTALILVDDIIEGIINNFNQEDFNYAIYGNNPDSTKAPLLKSSEIKPEKNLKVYPINVPNGTWHLYIEDSDVHQNHMLILSVIILILSFVFSYFVFKYLSTLDKENEKFKVLLKNATDYVHILDLKGNLIDCSDSFLKELGYSYEEALKLNVKDWDNEINDEKFKEFFIELSSNDIKVQTKFIRKDSSEIDVEIIARIIKIDKKEYIYASARDITQRLKLKNDLKNEKDLLDKLFDNVDAIVATILPDGTMNRVNKYTEILTGYTEEEISSKPYFWFEKFIPINIKPNIKAIIETIASGAVLDKTENAWIVKNGQKRLFEWSNKVIYENNEPSFLLSVGIDITDRKNLELELKDINENLQDRIQEATKKLNHSLEIIDKFVITSKSDINGKLIEVSNKFCEVSNYSKEELIGQTLSMLRHEDMDANVYREIWDNIKNGKTWYGRIKNKAKDGQAYWLDSIISPLYDENNNHIGCFSHSFDISQEVKHSELQQSYNKQLEEQLKEQIEIIRQKDLKMLDQARLASMGEMLSNIAHQWRQPLNVISLCSSGIAYSIQAGGMSKEDLEIELDYIQNSCDYLTKTIETFSRYLRKNKSYTVHPIKNEIESASYIISTSLKNNYIELIDEIDYTKNYKCYMVENELSQVILNILSNAEYVLKNRDDIKKKWIKLTSKEEDNSLIIMIEDNAGGVPEDIINKIFEPYFTTKFQSQGTGLGLSMSYSIITESMKGNLYVKNTQNGAKFYIKVPLS